MAIARYVSFRNGPSSTSDHRSICRTWLRPQAYNPSNMMSAKVCNARSFLVRFDKSWILHESWADLRGAWAWYGICSSTDRVVSWLSAGLQKIPDKCLANRNDHTGQSLVTHGDMND